LAEVLGPLLSRPLSGTGIGVDARAVRTIVLNGLLVKYLGSPVLWRWRR
jgi:hypothetical protein